MKIIARGINRVLATPDGRLVGRHVATVEDDKRSRYAYVELWQPPWMNEHPIMLGWQACWVSEGRIDFTNSAPNLSEIATLLEREGIKPVSPRQ